MATNPEGSTARNLLEEEQKIVSAASDQLLPLTRIMQVLRQRQLLAIQYHRIPTSRDKEKEACVELIKILNEEIKMYLAL